MNKQRREQQRKIKAQKQAAAKRKQALLKYGLLAGAALLVLFLILSFTQNMGLNVPASNTVIEADQTKGFKKSPVLLVEYSDFQCPACSAQHRTIRAAWKDIRHKVHLVYRHFPLPNIHPHATLAAHYAEAAGRQGKFWEMHDQLFDNQAIWSKMDDPAATFDDYAKTLKLDMAQLKTDLASDELKDKVKADIVSGHDSGVRGTPTLFINGKRLSNPRSKEQLTEAVDKAWSAR